MHMVRLNVNKRQNPGGEIKVENVDLDEKIRRIREANKKRERRFQEIEQDKKLALESTSVHKRSYNDSKRLQNSSMKGIQTASYKKTAKGRGQKLLEMSNCPLKAEKFETRTMTEQKMPENITLKNTFRSSMRERIRIRSKNYAVVENETTFHDSSSEEKFNSSPEDQSDKTTLKNEITLPENKEEIKNVPMSSEKTEPFKAAKEDTNALCDTDETTAKETSEIIDISKEETDKETSSTVKPTITVKLKKTASSSSFDESMAMLSPLDLPTNWGDIDFSDEELPPVTIW